MRKTNFLKSLPGLILSLVLCPPLAIYLLIRYDYMPKRWERVLGCVAGLYIAVVGFWVSATIDAHAASLEAEKVSAKEAEYICIERPIAVLSDDVAVVAFN